MNAAKKFLTLPEMGEIMVSLLDPRSVLSFVQSGVMEKVILLKSFTAKAWGNLIKRASDREEGLVDEEAVMVLSQLIQELKPDEPGHLLNPLLHLICETYPIGPVKIIYSCRPDPHIMEIPKRTFLLLEHVENSLGVNSTEQSLKSIRSYYLRLHEAELIAISSRMTRQKEPVELYIRAAYIQSRKGVEACL